MKPFKLDDIENKKTPFSVPEGYFEQLNNAILENTVEKKKSFSIRPIYIMAVAASLALLAVLGINFFTQDNELSAEEMLAQVSTEAISDYLDANDFTEAELINELDIDEIESFDNGLDFINDDELDEILYDEFLLDTNIN